MWTATFRGGTCRSHISNIVPTRLVETVWCSNFLPSLLNIYFLLNGFQSSLLLIYFREGPNRCSHYSKVMHKTYPLRDLHFRDRRGSPVKLCFSIKVIATEFFSTPFNGWMAIWQHTKNPPNWFGETWEKLAIKILNFHLRKPNFRKITNSDKTSDNCVLFTQEFSIEHR